ncbi:MAG: DUF4981 domain-containing protein [Oscillospiraceae bacterium]|nr:DUF4981 domain-containing protein [Oscillospiraceae bacterium]
MKTFDFNSIVKNPDVFADGRLPAHADFVPYRNAAELALGESSLRMSLDGIWRFRYARNPSAAPDGFWQPDYDISGWDSIRVPAHIQMEGYDVPAYVNTQYPWDAQGELQPGEMPELFNPVADYICTFSLPESFRGEEVCISLQGVESGFALWLNGLYIGYSEDSFTPSDFRLTEALCEGENRLAIRVWKWTPGSWFEDQDFFRFSGIFRSVFLYAVPKTAVTDLALLPLLEDDFLHGELRVSAETCGSGSLRLRLLQGGKLLLTREAPIDEAENRCAVALPVDHPLLWSAEAPSLYRLELEVLTPEGTLTELIAQDVGFRRIEIRDGILLLNGRRLVFHGVDRHDFSSVCGRVPNREELLTDILTMKRNNINAIRTSHYPNQSALYELCDRYGIYVMDENNMETHGSWDAFLRGKADPDYVIPKDHSEFAPLLLDRVRSTYQRDKNHPSVVLWSCGNESYGGSVIREMTRLFHRLDPHRPVHYEGITWDPSYPDTSDLESRMYTPAAEIEAFLAEHPEKPLICCEYSHAMGNSCGAMHKYTDLSEREMHYQGGFIWDYVDQTIWKKNRYGEWFLAYGGDHGERPTDYSFSGNGIVYGGDRRPSPKMQEVKFNYQDIRVAVTEDSVTVKNRFLFTDTACFRATAVLLSDGVEILNADLGTLSVPPLSDATFPLPSVLSDTVRLRRDAARSAGKAEPEFAVTVSFSLKEDCAWAKAGHEIAFGQAVLPREAVPFTCEEPLTLVRGKSIVGVRGKNFSAQFSAIQPGLTSYVYAGRELIEQIPMPNFWRAPTDNDKGSLMPQRYAQWKIASLYVTAKHEGTWDLYPEVKAREHSVLIRYHYYLPTTPESSCFVGYEVFGDGTIRTTLSYDAVKGLPDMPEFGMMFRFNADFDRVRWYGLGPEETYADRLRGAKLGRYERAVRDCLAEYNAPQESGNHCGVRRLQVVDLRGRGIEFFGENLSVNVLPWTPHELESAFHAYELPPVHYTVVRAAMQQMGVGGDDSWGARTHPEYLLPAEQDLSFSFCFRGI